MMAQLTSVSQFLKATDGPTSPAGLATASTGEDFAHMLGQTADASRYEVLPSQAAQNVDAAKLAVGAKLTKVTSPATATKDSPIVEEPSCIPGNRQLQSRVAQLLPVDMAVESTVQDAISKQSVSSPAESLPRTVLAPSGQPAVIPSSTASGSVRRAQQLTLQSGPVSTLRSEGSKPATVAHSVAVPAYTQVLNDSDSVSHQAAGETAVIVPASFQAADTSANPVVITNLSILAHPANYVAPSTQQVSDQRNDRRPSTRLSASQPIAAIRKDGMLKITNTAIPSGADDLGTINSADGISPSGAPFSGATLSPLGTTVTAISDQSAYARSTDQSAKSEIAVTPTAATHASQKMVLQVPGAALPSIVGTMTAETAVAPATGRHDAEERTAVNSAQILSLRMDLVVAGDTAGGPNPLASSVHAVGFASGIATGPATSVLASHTRLTSTHEITSTSSESFTALTAGDGLPYTSLRATPTSLEVGVSSETHGWLKIRAEMAVDGGVSASLTGTSPAAAHSLRSELPALTSYLQGEKVQVNSLAIAESQPLAIAASETFHLSDLSKVSGDAGQTVLMADPGGTGHRHAQPEAERSATGLQEDREEIHLPNKMSTVAAGYAIGPGDSGSEPSFEYESGGSWLNVRV